MWFRSSKFRNRTFSCSRLQPLFLVRILKFCTLQHHSLLGYSMMYYALRMMDYSWALSVESVQAASRLLQIVIPGYSNSTDSSNALGLILIDSSMFLDVLWFVPTVCILDFLNPTQSSISIGRQFDMEQPDRGLFRSCTQQVRRTHP